MNDMRLGDLDALLDKFLRSYTEQEKVGNFQFVAREIKQGFADMVCEQPTIDAVPVVRCGECERRDKGFVSEKGTISCPYMEAFMPADGFGSYGERKDGEG